MIQLNKKCCVGAKQQSLTKSESKTNVVWIIYCCFYRYKDVADPAGQGDKYAWNPCEPFTLNDCKNVAVS